MPRRPYLFTDAEVREILRLYQSGLTAKEVAARLNRSYTAVRRVLTDAGYRLQARCGIYSHRRPHPRHPALTEEQKALIVALYEQGYTATDIARGQGLYYPYVRKYLHECGYYLYARSGRKPVVLEPEDARLAEDLYRAGRSLTAIQSALPRRYPLKTIRRHLESVGLYRAGGRRNADKGPVTPEEVSRMVQLHQSGLSAGKIAELLGRSKSVVCRHLARAGIKLVDKRSGLPEERKELIRRLASLGKGINQIARETGHSPATVAKVLKAARELAAVPHT